MSTARALTDVIEGSATEHAQLIGDRIVIDVDALAGLEQAQASDEIQHVRPEVVVSLVSR